MPTPLYGSAPTNQNMPRTSLVSKPIRDSLSKIPQRSARRPISFGRELLHYLKTLLTASLCMYEIRGWQHHTARKASKENDDRMCAAIV